MVKCESINAQQLSEFIPTIMNELLFLVLPRITPVSYFGIHENGQNAIRAYRISYEKQAATMVS